MERDINLYKRKGNLSTISISNYVGCGIIVVIIIAIVYFSYSKYETKLENIKTDQKSVVAELDLINQEQSEKEIKKDLSGVLTTKQKLQKDLVGKKNLVTNNYKKIFENIPEGIVINSLKIENTNTIDMNFTSLSLVETAALISKFELFTDIPSSVFPVENSDKTITIKFKVTTK